MEADHPRHRNPVSRTAPARRDDSLVQGADALAISIRDRPVAFDVADNATVAGAFLAGDNRKDEIGTVLVGFGEGASEDAIAGVVVVMGTVVDKCEAPGVALDDVLVHRPV